VRLAVAVALAGALVLSVQSHAARQSPLTGWLTFGNGAARIGAASSPLDPKSLDAKWFRETDGMVTAQPLVVHNVPSRGQTTVYVATVHGRVIAYAPNGYVRWQRTLGAAPNSCDQLDEYGITGTPVVDPATRALYVADGFGLLHSLDLVTGRDRAGWPLQIYSDPTAELVWGALSIVNGSVYVGTGSYCDRAMVGKLIRVQIATRRVTSWTAVPASLGGGGSVWGWGGAAYSRARNALFVVTGNAFEGGSNTGAAFDESAGYGEHLVELTPDLRVLASDHPADVTGTDDFDFIGSPVVFTPPGCGELVAAANKNGHVFVWRSASIGDGPIADVSVAPQSVTQPLLTQLAYDAQTRSLYSVTFTSLVRVSIDGCSGAHVAWSTRFPQPTLQGSPTVAGSVVWLALSSAPARLRGYDASTGKLLYDRAIGGMSFAPPAAASGWLFEGAEHGLADRSAVGSKPAEQASLVRGYTSWSDKQHGWQSRESGVYATDDAGRTWHRIYRFYAQRVVRLSSTRGVISVGAGAISCACRQRQLWTADGGRTWHETRALTADFTGNGNDLYTWTGNEVRRASWPPARSLPLTTTPETVADAAAVPGGVAVLLTATGHGFDNSARLELVLGDTVSTVTLPALAGRVEARALTVSWPDVTVRTYVFTDEGRRTVRWRSTNGGKSWRAV
jgi:hypothetical protein